MKIRVELGRRKPESRVFIDDLEITRGLLNFQLHDSWEQSGLPAITLVMWPGCPGGITVSGDLEQAEVIKRDLLERMRDLDPPPQIRRSDYAGARCRRLPEWLAKWLRRSNVAKKFEDYL